MPQSYPGETRSNFSGNFTSNACHYCMGSPLKKKNNDILYEVKQAISDERWSLARSIARSTKDRDTCQYLLRIINYERRVGTDKTITLVLPLYSNNIEARISKKIDKLSSHGYVLFSRVDDLPRRPLNRALDSIYPRIRIRLDFVRKRFSGVEYGKI